MYGRFAAFGALGRDLWCRPCRPDQLFRAPPAAAVAHAPTRSAGQVPGDGHNVRSRQRSRRRAAACGAAIATRAEPTALPTPPRLPSPSAHRVVSYQRQQPRWRGVGSVGSVSVGGTGGGGIGGGGGVQRRRSVSAGCDGTAGEVPTADEASTTKATSSSSTSSRGGGDAAGSPKPKKQVSLPTAITPPSLHDLGLFREGALLVDKPLEWTSFDVCNKLRRMLKFLGHTGKRFKVGHAGTLDPMATGLLIVCTGKGTKAIDMFVAMHKCYSGTIRLGEGTATYDAEAEVTERLPWEHITDEQLEAAAAQFLGDQQQVPPMFSAIKIKGQKLYDLARQGVMVEREPRDVHISRFAVSRDASSPQDVRFEVDCSKGTYIRSLAHDFGEALGTAAHMTSLRREAIGQYHVRDAWPLDDLLKELTAAKERLAEQGDAGAEQPLSEKEH